MAIPTIETEFRRRLDEVRAGRRGFISLNAFVAACGAQPATLVCDLASIAREHGFEIMAYGPNGYCVFNSLGGARGLTQSR